MYGFLLNPLPRGAVKKSKAKKKKGSTMAKKKRRAKKQGAAKKAGRRRVATKARPKRKTAKKARRKAKRKVAKKVAVTVAAVKRGTRKAKKAIKKKKTSRKNLTPFFKFMMGLPGKQSVAKAKKAGAQWRKMSDTQKAKWGAVTNETQRKAARKASRKRSKKKAKAKRKETGAYKAWKSKRGKSWVSNWKSGMKKSMAGKGESSYLRALREGVSQLNPFRATRKRRGSKKRRRNPMAKRSRKSRRKTSRRRRNPMRLVAQMKGMTTKSAVQKYGWVTLGVVSGAVVPSLLSRGIGRLVPSVNLDTPLMRAGLGVVGAMLAGSATSIATKSQEKGMLVTSGGIASVIGAYAVAKINQYIPGVSGLGYLGATDNQIRAAVESEIRKELGVGDYVTQQMISGSGVGSYATQSLIDAAPQAAGLGLESADDVMEVDTFEGGAF